ncbi:restriction endonuclease subunit S [Citrobacter sp. Cs237]|uniref:restriction endonuclease subunit S n=1 Tax=Citrobacter TaxID=544 RepID=UPI00257582D0|nr:restriction endonuclease subunit S [Citrobacter sp. Cs237]MDM2749737.1 restriction endonuclease subunit S [Citrobacter sp. Cs237]HBU8850599.1 restriction endonuclease subunit S [Citrobacter sedlakii]
MTVEKLITDHIDIWSSALQTRSTAGRGSNGKIDLYGIKKLRELILELAVRGKLVPQDPNDEPASELLKRIAVEKAELVKQGKIKKQKPLPEISEDEKPFELPEGWEWVRLGNVGVCSTGKTPSTSVSSHFNGNIPFVGPGQITQCGEITQADKFLSEDGMLNSTEANNGDIFTVCIGGSIGKSAVVSERVAFNQQINSIKPVLVDSKYIYFSISTTLFISSMITASTGSATPIINRSKWESLLIPCAPVAEQHSIVARVNELMALCDQLEQQSLISLEAHQQLVETLLATLVDSQHAEDLTENWARISQHFDTLFTTEASIDALKQTILQLAVMGKLVQQDPDDEPASELLKRIEQEKAKLVKEGKIKKQKPLPPISEDEKPFELPKGWEWCRTEDIGDLKLGRQRSPKDHHGPHMTPYLRVANVHDNEIRVDDVKFMNFTPEEKTIFSLQYGDILLNEGQSLELVGRPAIFKNEIAGACFQNTLIRFRVNEFISNEYALAYFRHCLYSGRFQKAATQTTNIAHLSVSRLAPIEFPLPSYSEQLKIVIKIKELEVLCEKIKIGVKSAQQTQLHLADALTDAALN